MKSKYLVRGAYNYDEALFSDESTIEHFGPSMTNQSQRDDADINVIIKRLLLTGQAPDQYQGTYGDFDADFDFHTAQNLIRQGTEAFNRLPAETRTRFDNDPAKFHDFVVDPANLDELRKLGLAAPKAPESTPAGPAGPEPTVAGKPASDPEKGSSPTKN